MLWLATPLPAQLKIRSAAPLAEVEGGTVVQLLFHINNHSYQNVPTQLLFSGPFPPINRISDTVIAAGDSLLVSVRLYIPRKAPADSQYVHTLKAVTVKGEVAAATALRLKPVRMVQLSVLQPEVYLLQRQDSVVLRLHCSNPGNQAATVQLTAEDPALQQVLGQQTITLAGFADTTLQLHMRLPAVSGPVLLKGTYANGDIFSLQQIPFYQARSGSRYNAAAAEMGKGHLLGLYSRLMGTQAAYYELLANGAEKNFSYQADALWYREAMQDQLVVMNTFAKLRTGVLEWTAGNIFKTDEFVLAGRGAQLAVETPQTRIEGGAVNGNYNLAGDMTEGDFRYSNAVYLRYEGRRQEKMQLHMQALQQWDGGARVNHSLGGGGFRWQLAKNHSLALKGYASYSTTSPYKTDSLYVWGGAGGLDYSGRFGKWQLSSGNYISSGGYAGLQKGAMNLEERLSFSPHHRQHFWWRYSRLSYEPVYISPLYRHYPNIYFSETAEFGWQQQLGERWSLTLRPYYYREYLENTARAELSAARGNVQLMYNGTLSFSFNAEGATGTTNTDGHRDYSGFRIMSFLQYRGLGLSAILQHGPFYTGELLQMRYTGQPYRTYMIGPGYTGRLLKGRLHLSVYDYLSYSNYYRQWEHNVNARIGVSLPYGFALEGGLLAYRFAGTNVTTKAFDVGIVKKFRNAPQHPRQELELFFYRDFNANNQHEPWEGAAADILVKVGEEVLISGKDGRVVYRNLPAGHYPVSVLQAKGAYAESRTVMVKGRTQMAIPLHAIGTIQGRLMLQEDDKGQLPPITVKATGRNGKVYTVLSNEQGAFVFFLPHDVYRLQVEPGAQFMSPEGAQTVELQTDKTAEVSFELHYRPRDVKVKKFYSVRTK